MKLGMTKKGKSLLFSTIICGIIMIRVMYMIVNIEIIGNYNIFEIMVEGVITFWIPVIILGFLIYLIPNKEVEDENSKRI